MLTKSGDGGLDYEVQSAGYIPTASPSEQSTAIGKPKITYNSHTNAQSHKDA